MGTNKQRSTATDDPLIDEVRTVRRQICAEFSNNVDRLAEHLQVLERQYAQREGVFACVTTEAADAVVASWGPESYPTDDPVIDEVREIRRNRT